MAYWELNGLSQRCLKVLCGVKAGRSGGIWGKVCFSSWGWCDTGQWHQNSLMENACETWYLQLGDRSLSVPLRWWWLRQTALTDVHLCAVAQKIRGTAVTTCERSCFTSRFRHRLSSLVWHGMHGEARVPWWLGVQLSSAQRLGLGANVIRFREIKK